MQTDTHKLFEYQLQKPLEAKLLRELQQLYTLIWSEFKK